jgi:hypothetical protein
VRTRTCPHLSAPARTCPHPPAPVRTRPHLAETCYDRNLMSGRTTRPLERFWPYVEKPEEPTADELAALDPDLYAALFGPRDLPFSITLAFGPFAGENYARAVTMAKASAEYREVGTGIDLRHRARFFPGDAMRMRDLFELVGPEPSCDVLVDDRPIPYARDLWLPLVWFLLLP